MYIARQTRRPSGQGDQAVAANLRTKILDFGGFDSSIILISRGGILMSIGDFPESLSQRILAGRFLVGRLGVVSQAGRREAGFGGRQPRPPAGASNQAWTTSAIYNYHVL